MDCIRYKQILTFYINSKYSNTSIIFNNKLLSMKCYLKSYKLLTFIKYGKPRSFLYPDFKI